MSTSPNAQYHLADRPLDSPPTLAGAKDQKFKAPRRDPRRDWKSGYPKSKTYEKLTGLTLFFLASVFLITIEP